MTSEVAHIPDCLLISTTPDTASCDERLPHGLAVQIHSREETV